MDEVSTYILVEWTAEKKFSVVKRDAIQDPTEKLKLDEELIGRSIIVSWKNKGYEATIIQCGSKTNMNYELGVLLKQQKPIANEKCAPTQEADAIEDVLDRLEVNIEPQCDEPVLILKISKLEADLELEKESKTKYKNKYKNLKRKYDELRVKSDDTSQFTELANGVSLPKSQLDTIISLSDSAEKLARNLMRALFQEEEMLGHSLFGKSCNANLGHVPVRPSIDPVRRDAIISFTLAKYGGSVAVAGNSTKNKNPLLSLLHRSLGDMLRSLSRKKSNP